MNGRADKWIRWTTTGCVALLALIAATVSYLHMHMLVEIHGQPGWVATLTPFSVDGMIVAASTTLLADSRGGDRGGFLPWVLLAIGSVASLTANVAVAEPTTTGRVIAAWPSFALIAAYEMLMRQVRRSATSVGSSPRRGELGEQCPPFGPQTDASDVAVADRAPIGRELQRQAWRWAQANRSSGGALPSGSAIARQFGRHERWGRFVKRSGCDGEFTPENKPHDSSPSIVSEIRQVIHMTDELKQDSIRAVHDTLYPLGRPGAGDAVANSDITGLCNTRLRAPVPLAQVERRL